jgi:hypothetical protein
MRAGRGAARRRSSGISAAVFGIAIVGACASPPARLDAPKVVFGVTLAPYAAIDECFALEPGERVGYRFSATLPVSFNVHFHDGNAVVMPVTSDRTTSESGAFAADRKQVYCATWEAGAEGSVVDYRINPWPRLQ